MTDEKHGLKEFEARWIEGGKPLTMERKTKDWSDQTGEWPRDFGLYPVATGGNQVIGVGIWVAPGEESGATVYFVIVDNADEWSVYCSESLERAAQLAGSLASVLTMSMIEIKLDELLEETRKGR